MPNWTEQQLDAIGDRGHSLIVCAAAGSGKTAVLTQRITELVREGTPLSAMLIVTFTRAAAGEMRGRIASALRAAADAEKGEARAFLLGQSFSVGQAQISTLHSFCGSVLREHFGALPVDPGFRIGDDQECGVLRAQAMEDALYGCYEAESEAFLAADRRFPEEDLAGMARRLADFASQQPDPGAWIGRALSSLQGTDERLLSSGAVRVLTREAAARLSGAEREAEKTLELCGGDVPPAYADACSSDLRLVRGLLAAAREGGYAELHAACAGLEFKASGGGVSLARLPAGRKPMDRALADGIRARRKALGARLGKCLAPFSAPPEDAAADIRATALPLAGVAELAGAYTALYRAAKRRRGILDFDDLEREALSALTGEDPAVRRALARRYRYVFVDEYQDSSAVQEAILSSFARLEHDDALFQVGDVKQSIYRFRRAEPSLFRNKAALYAGDGTPWARRIDLNRNFRSRANILAGVNAVFGTLMYGDVTEIDYDARERLYPGLPERQDDPPLELHVLTAPDEEDEEEQEEQEESDPAREASREEREAAVAAERILQLHGTPMTDGRTGETRPMRWSDFCVLMRTVKGSAARAAEILGERGVPVYCDVGQEYFEIPEIRQMIALLQAVDSGVRDLPLMAALRGPALGFTDEDLAEIRIAAGPRVSFCEAVRLAEQGEGALALRLRQAREKLETWRLSAAHQGVDRLIGRIFAETQMELRAASMPDGAACLSNLHLLESRARRFAETGSGSLHAFLSYVERLKAGGDSASASAVGEAEDVVRVMSVHKSKGLEFPAVLLLGMGRKVTGKAEREERLLLDDELGAALPCVDTELSTVRRTLTARAILARQAGKALAEEIRVLYVAMTRARERLILVGQPRGGRVPALWRAGTGKETLPDVATELDMVCRMLGAAGASFEEAEQAVEADGSRWRVFLHDSAAGAGEAAAAGAEERLRRMARGEAPESLRALFDFTPAAGRTLRKTSVSAVVRDEKFRQADPEDERREPEALRRGPRYLTGGELTGAEIGTAFHRAACVFDLQALRACEDLAGEVRRQFEDMAARGVLSEKEASALRREMLERLFASPLGRRMLNSERVEREWAFTWKRNTEVGEQLVQGVIDCCFVEDGSWILVDYKTDAQGDAGLARARHGAQLALYAGALEALTGRPVRERIVWLVRHGTAVPV